MLSEPLSLSPSYYEASVTRLAPEPPLAGEETADVCVIGGGFTGLSCALKLALAGRKVVLLESAVIAWGASGRNGGQFIHGYSTGNLAACARDANVDEKTLFDLSLQAIIYYGNECAIITLIVIYGKDTCLPPSSPVIVGKWNNGKKPWPVMGMPRAFWICWKPVKSSLLAAIAGRCLTKTAVIYIL